MSEVFRTDDDLVTKLIHADGSETSIKTVSSCDTVRNPVSGKLELNNVDRNKYSIFLSASAGCPMKCSFCYLTIDQVPYGKLTTREVVNNIKESLITEAAHKPSITDRYAKICWMGMGEPITNPDMVYTGTLELMEFINQNRYARGLDGVDLSSVIPRNSTKWIDKFKDLNYDLGRYTINPNNKKVVHSESTTEFPDYQDRSRFRLFYSLHSAIQSTRNKIIPNATPLVGAAEMLREASKHFNVIFHHMFIDGVNDTEEEIVALIDWMKTNGFENNELRILRYNKHDRSDIKESDVFEKCICMLPNELPRVKVQISAGKEVKSACGQFIFNDTDAVKQYKD